MEADDSFDEIIAYSDDEPVSDQELELEEQEELEESNEPEKLNKTEGVPPELMFVIFGYYKK